MKTTDTLTDILQLAKTVKSSMQMETLSKQLLQNIGKLNTTTEVYAVQKCHHMKNKCFHQILEVPVVGNHPAGKKVERNLVIVVVPTFQSNVSPTAKNVSNARRKIISQSIIKVQIKSHVVRLAILKVFQGKTFMKWKKQSLDMTLILCSLNKSSSQHMCFILEKILQTLRKSCFDEMSESKNYTLP